ncbi:hypothetical protein [Abyssalbus ytuae]|uniref:Uncharacterized protein n=1 Tax=Abyssalbus ytuae TaxID=2926907 RepID=A0A9E6ZVI3_9FLAO|nr:hypothetical protein [Abyssalbus ytuae]UOB15997.1 hypothetical protein MQE35_09615 [Abyssalbus ytuae]
MKIFSLIFIVIAFAVCVYNITLVNFSNPFEGDSMIAVIGVLATLCAILLITILYLSKRVQEKIKENA